MYRIVLVSEGVPPASGEAGARGIAEEFTHRPWHKNVKSEWDGSRIIIQADNDFDSDGSALADEFSDAISACVPGLFDRNIVVVSVTPTLL